MKYDTRTARLLASILLIAACLSVFALLSGCAAYERHVSARSLSVQGDERGNFGGTYRVEYRAFK